MSAYFFQIEMFQTTVAGVIEHYKVTTIFANHQIYK